MIYIRGTSMIFFFLFSKKKKNYIYIYIWFGIGKCFWMLLLLNMLLFSDGFCFNVFECHYSKYKVCLQSLIEI